MRPARIVVLFWSWVALATPVALAEEPDKAAPAFVCRLDIPPRLQWHEHNGYCGEMSIQSCALRYGVYVSQYQARAMIDPSQKFEVLLGINETKVLDRLRLTYLMWDFAHAPLPQYRDYLGWTKRQLAAGYPVIGGVYMPKETSHDYDHIVPIVGFRSAQDATTFHGDDELTLYDLFDLTPFTRSFRTLCATREEAHVSRKSYHVPVRIDYGCALTGVVDPEHETLPVELAITGDSEPNLIAGQKPTTLQARLVCKSLFPGRRYRLLRYDDYHEVPLTRFASKGGFRSDLQFTATAATHEMTDTFSSDSCVIYRCVADGT